MSFRPGVVITACAGREENLRRTIEHLAAQRRSAARIVVVFDGSAPCDLPDPGVPLTSVEIPKHQPGREQPRNVGAEVLRRQQPDATHVLFLDSDLIFGPDLLNRYATAATRSPGAILIGPYDWLAPRDVSMPEGLRNDPRWASFTEHQPGHLFVHHIGAGLACFGGNLVWPLHDFERIGGFHPELHHGRCEDGELGLRAAAAGMPMTLVADARAWHVWHPVHLPDVHAKNARDVPLINQWHPWVQAEGLIPVEKDGIRFDWRCPDCSQTVNSGEYWAHKAGHR